MDAPKFWKGALHAKISKEKSGNSDYQNRNLRSRLKIGCKPKHKFSPNRNPTARFNPNPVAGRRKNPKKGRAGAETPTSEGIFEFNEQKGHLRRLK